MTETLPVSDAEADFENLEDMGLNFDAFEKLDLEGLFAHFEEEEVAP